MTDLIDPATLAPNVELLNAVLLHIEEHPEEWDQQAWAREEDTACGTACCVAGHAVILSGHRIHFMHDGREFGVYGTKGELDADGHPGREPNGNLSISQFARRELRLNPMQAEALFSGGNTFAHLKQIVADIAAGEQRPRWSLATNADAIRW